MKTPTELQMWAAIDANFKKDGGAGIASDLFMTRAELVREFKKLPADERAASNLNRSN